MSNGTYVLLEGGPSRTPLLFGQKSFFACLFNTNRDPFFIDVPDAFRGYLQRDVLVFLRNEKFFCLQVGIKYPFGLVVRVRNLVSRHVCLPCNFTNPCHCCTLKMYGSSKWSAKIGRIIYICKCGLVFL